MVTVRSIKKLIVIGSAMLLLFWSVFALTDPAEKYPTIDLYLEDDSLVWESPTWFRPRHLAMAPRDISYWKKILPYEEDRYADRYMVIPQLGLITPIQQIPQESGDWWSMVNGYEISLNKYLQWWIIEYAGSVAPWHRWKRIDFWHSNYYAHDTWRYKTVFAHLMRLDEGDEVWYFVRNGDLYDLHRYVVTASYPTKPSNVASLQRDGDGADALIFGCYHGLDGRWMVEASYTWDPVMPTPTAEEQDQFAALSAYRKSRIDTGMYHLSQMAPKWRKAHIANLYSRIQTYKEQHALTIQENLVLSYMIDGFTKLYE